MNTKASDEVSVATEMPEIVDDVDVDMDTDQAFEAADDCNGGEDEDDDAGARRQ